MSAIFEYEKENFTKFPQVGYNEGLSSSFLLALNIWDAPILSKIFGHANALGHSNIGGKLSQCEKEDHGIKTDSP